jgi:hypothetical protein
MAEAKSARRPIAIEVIAVEVELIAVETFGPLMVRQPCDHNELNLIEGNLMFEAIDKSMHFGLEADLRHTA